MARHIRYTCNKKNEPTMREDCQKCPEFNPCAKEGKWCFVGALCVESENTRVCAECTASNGAEMVAPVMRDMSTVTIHLGDGQSFDILREDVKKRLYEDLYKHLYQDLCM